MINKLLFMKIKTQKLVFIFLLSSIPFDIFTDGGDERTGPAGASELLINPWSQSSGMASANTASRVESSFLNVAGLTGINRLMFSHTSWFADISVNAFGFGQKVSDTGSMSLAIMSLILVTLKEQQMTILMVELVHFLHNL